MTHPSPSICDDEPTRPVRRHSDVVPRSEVCIEGALRLRDVIAEGGMGIVRSAVQAPLDRPVAVKMLRAGHDEEQADALVREALVIGMLEHPNIVPLYAAGLADDGSPVLVMKQIDGRLWTDLLDADPHNLDRHIDVLMKVCCAVQYAHDRGIVHRDLKPDNVMVGELGEVYVLDWGLAVTTREDLSPRIPLARDVDVPAGTPAYMAPEMALGLAVDERTDVYLLGAMLHEIVTGEAPHMAATLHEAVASSTRQAPHAYGEGVDAELAAICHDAMRYDPVHRFGGPEAMRVALADYLSHRASRALVRVAERRARALERLLATDEPNIVLAHRLFTEARFAYHQALRDGPDNAAARRGLEALLESMVEHHLRRENRDEAAALMEELPAPRSELARQLVSLVDRVERRNHQVRELEARRRDNDLTESGALRRRMSLVFVALTALCTLLLGARVGFDIERGSYVEPLAIAGAYLAMLLGALPFNARLNVANRRLHATMIAVTAFACLVLGAAWWLGTPVRAGLVLTMATMAAGFAVAGLAIHPRLFFVTLAMLGGAIGVALVPSLAYATLVIVLGAAIFSLAATDAPWSGLYRWGIGR